MTTYLLDYYNTNNEIWRRGYSVEVDSSITDDSAIKAAVTQKLIEKNIETSLEDVCEFMGSGRSEIAAYGEVYWSYLISERSYYYQFRDKPELKIPQDDICSIVLRNLICCPDSQGYSTDEHQSEAEGEKIIETYYQTPCKSCGKLPRRLDSSHVTLDKMCTPYRGDSESAVLDYWAIERKKILEDYLKSKQIVKVFGMAIMYILLLVSFWMFIEEKESWLPLAVLALLCPWGGILINAVLRWWFSRKEDEINRFDPPQSLVKKGETTKSYQRASFD